MQLTDELLRVDANGSPVFTADMEQLIAAHADRILDSPASMRQVSPSALSGFLACPHLWPAV